uniref:VTT domain-containing protein n=1 Tax=Caldiarchaeum subterraneum TaxID=311458 RepID=A0A7J3G4Z5_CALS0
MENWLETIAVTYGPLGVFAVSLLGSILPFVPVPYLIVVVLLSDTVNPFILGFAAGIGGSIGKITSYIIGRLGYRLLSAEKKKSMDTLREVIGKYGDIGVFIFALTPLPDDVYIIPAGMVKLSFWRFLLANTAGKILLAILVALLGRTYFEYTKLLLGDVSWLSTVLATLAMITITVILRTTDGDKLLKTLKESGWRGILRNYRPWKKE